MGTKVDSGNFYIKDSHEFYMNIAIAVRRKANCLKRKVGVLIIKENRIISAGYNGTPENMQNCVDGGCVRCSNPEKYGEGVDYDKCICVHGEQNALITAARFGIPIQNAVAYSTLRPCFDCTKALLQAKLKAIYYIHDWKPTDELLLEQYQFIQNQFPDKVNKIEFEDPHANWANNVTTTLTTSSTDYQIESDPAPDGSK